MSGTVIWYPKNKGNALNHNNQLIEALKALYVGFPIALSQNDIDKLEGMDAAGVAGARELIDAILNYDVIMVEIAY